MKVYLLVEVFDYEGKEIIGVFSSVEAAKAFSPGEWQDRGFGLFKTISKSMREIIDEYEVI